MKTRSNIGFLFALVLAFAGVSALVGGNCADGFCALSGVYAQVNRGPAAPKRDPLMEGRKEAVTKDLSGDFK